LQASYQPSKISKIAVGRLDLTHGICEVDQESILSSENDSIDDIESNDSEVKVISSIMDKKHNNKPSMHLKDKKSSIWKKNINKNTKEGHKKQQISSRKQNILLSPREQEAEEQKMKHSQLLARCYVAMRR
jgi:hypothetical protein